MNFSSWLHSVLRFPNFNSSFSGSRFIQIFISSVMDLLIYFFATLAVSLQIIELQLCFSSILGFTICSWILGIVVWIVNYYCPSLIEDWVGQYFHVVHDPIFLLFLKCCWVLAVCQCTMNRLAAVFRTNIFLRIWVKILWWISQLEGAMMQVQIKFIIKEMSWNKWGTNCALKEVIKLKKGLNDVTLPSSLSS